MSIFEEEYKQELKKLVAENIKVILSSSIQSQTQQATLTQFN